MTDTEEKDVARGWNAGLVEAVMLVIAALIGVLLHPLYRVWRWYDGR